MGANIGLLLSSLQGVGQAAQGQAQARAASRQAAEVVRATEAEARVAGKRASKAAATQRVQFAAAGVELEGSPLLVLEETRQEGLDEVRDIVRAGAAEARGIQAEGRGALFSGAFSALDTIGSGAQRAGLFGSGKPDKDTQSDFVKAPGQFVGELDLGAGNPDSSSFVGPRRPRRRRRGGP